MLISIVFFLIDPYSSSDQAAYVLVEEPILYWIPQLNVQIVLNTTIMDSQGQMTDLANSLSLTADSGYFYNLNKTCINIVN